LAPVLLLLCTLWLNISETPKNQNPLTLSSLLLRTKPLSSYER
jgi:hypothetical protein